MDANMRKPPVGPYFNIEIYPMNHLRRGRALIFNQNKFLNDVWEERVGSEKDVDRLKEELTSLGFEVDVQIDKTFEEVQAKLESVSKEHHDDADCLIVVVMSHGGKLYPKNKDTPENNEITGPVGEKYNWDQFPLQLIAAYDRPYDEKELFKFFEGDNCPSLVTKPKIFFIQACRGDGPLTKHKKSKFEAYLSDRGNEKVDINRTPCTIPNSADFLIFRATVDGIYASRDEVTGTPFIKSLCDQLKENKNKGDEALDLESLLVNVKRNLVKDEQGSQMPCVYSTLIRKLYLTPKNF